MTDKKQDVSRKLEQQNAEEIKLLKGRLLRDKQLQDSHQEAEGGKKLGKAVIKGLGDVAKSLASPNNKRRMKIAQLPSDRSEIPIVSNYDDKNGFAFIRDEGKYGSEMSYAKRKGNNRYIPYDDHYQCKVCGYGCPEELRQPDDTKNRLKWFRGHFKEFHKEELVQNNF